jgi:hypothetical protein
MTDEELIRKGREHIRAIERPNSYGAPSDAYDEARVVQTTLIYFGSQKRSDYIEALLNSETGEPISIAYHPSL